MVRSDPSARPLTYEDYCKIPDDGLRHEIIEGVEHVNPAPVPFHQTVSRRIQFVLYQAIELAGHGQVFNAPIDVQLGPHDIVQPDIAVIANHSTATIGEAKIDGPPDLVVEILSPSTRFHDQHRKRKLYERCGVPEYWIVDPRERTVQRLRAVEQQYVEQPVQGRWTYDSIGHVRVAFDAALIFAD